MKVALAIVVLALLTGPAAVAQSDSGVSLLLPAGDELGPGWDSSQVPGLDGSTGNRAYGGPGGARLTLAISLLEPDTADRSWQGVRESIETFTENEIAGGTLTSNTPPVDGCQDVLWANGVESAYIDFTISITACRTDRAVLFAKISGEWRGKAEVEASDSLIQLLLDHMATASL